MVKLRIEKMRVLDPEHGFLQGSFDTRSFPIFFCVSSEADKNSKWFIFKTNRMRIRVSRDKYLPQS